MKRIKLYYLLFHYFFQSFADTLLGMVCSLGLSYCLAGLLAYTASDYEFSFLNASVFGLCIFGVIIISNNVIDSFDHAVEQLEKKHDIRKYKK